MISKQQVEEMKARWEATTEGPWLGSTFYGMAEDDGREDAHGQEVFAKNGKRVVDHRYGVLRRADSEAIGHARVDHPATLAALEEAMEVVEELVGSGLLPDMPCPCGGGYCATMDKTRALIAKWRGDA